MYSSSIVNTTVGGVKCSAFTFYRLRHNEVGGQFCSSYPYLPRQFLEQSENCLVLIAMRLVPRQSQTGGKNKSCLGWGLNPEQFFLIINVH